MLEASLRIMVGIHRAHGRHVELWENVSINERYLNWIFSCTKLNAFESTYYDTGFFICLEVKNIKAKAKLKLEFMRFRTEHLHSIFSGAHNLDCDAKFTLFQPMIQL